MYRALGVALVLAACAHDPAPAPTGPSVAAAVPVDGSAPRPFAAEQIRAAMPVGHVVRFRATRDGVATEQRWTVVAADATSCTIASQRLAADGSLIEDEGQSTSTWRELVDHARFPAAATRIADGAVTVPAGHFATRRYVVRGDDGTIRTLDFAPSLPGPPVLMRITDGGREVYRLELLERR